MQIDVFLAMSKEYKSPSVVKSAIGAKPDFFVYIAIRVFCQKLGSRCMHHMMVNAHVPSKIPRLGRCACHLGRSIFLQPGSRLLAITT